MIKRTKKTINNEIGSMSLWFAIAGLIGVTIVASLLGNFKVMRAMSEVQGTIDVAGVSALRVGVDENAWRDGKLVVDRSTVYNTFNTLVDKEFLKKSIGARDIRIEQSIRTREEIFNDGAKRPVVYLITNTYITLPFSQALDVSKDSQLNYYDFFDSKYDSISLTGVENDGWAEVLVRSISRLVLR